VFPSSTAASVIAPVLTPRTPAAQSHTTAGRPTATPSCRRFVTLAGPPQLRPPRLAGSPETAPSSTTPTVPHNAPDDPTPQPRPAASPQTSHATSATLPSAGTSTAARSSSGSASRPANASDQTPRHAPAGSRRSTPSARRHDGSARYPGRSG